jgi:periplasmic mercuric ion binding protein
MKRILVAALVAAFFSSPAMAARSIKANVNGLVCSFCAAAIEKRLKALSEVKAVYVNLTTKVVAVELKDGKDIAPEKIAEEIKDSGYEVVTIVRSEQTIQQIRAEKSK